MTKLKLLLVEDSQSDIEAFKESMERYQAECGIEVEFCIAENVDQATMELNNSYDGAIIDLKLDMGGDEGNKVIDSIRSGFRMPIIVFSGTPDHFSTDKAYVLEICKKGEIEYIELVKKIEKVYKTGLTRIMGGRGVIEQAIDKVFWENLYTKIPIWERYADSGKNTEKALLRYTINHLLELMDNEESVYFSEEMYLHPPIAATLQTGTIILEKVSQKLHIVLSPACDMVWHGSSCKTDRILLCEIDKPEMSLVRKYKKELKKEDTEPNAKNCLQKLVGNNLTMYYHYLPPVDFFEGGFINFRYIKSYKMKDINKEFEPVNVQISAQFIKDIVSRFSSYYARQGQPDFDRDALYTQLSGV